MEEEINLREYLEVLVRRRKLIIYSTLAIAAIAFVLSVSQKPVYEAKTTLLVWSGGGGGSFSQYAGLAGLAGINVSGGKVIDDLVEVVRSQAVAARVLDDLKLEKKIPGWDDPKIDRQKLVLSVGGFLLPPKVTGNLVELGVRSGNPLLAAEVANGFADALSYCWNRLNYTEAKKKKEYIEAQLPKVEKELKEAEKKYKKFTLIVPRLGMSSAGPELARLQQELEIQNTVYTMLRKEYETTKLEESKEIPPFSVVDRAVKPDFRISPKIKFNTMVGMVVGLFVGIFGAFFQEYWKKSGGERA